MIVIIAALVCRLFVNVFDKNNLCGLELWRWVSSSEMFWVESGYILGNSFKIAIYLLVLLLVVGLFVDF